MPDIGRNDPCHCGSGKKYKKCCEAKDEQKSHTALEKQWEKAQKHAAATHADAPKDAHPKTQAPVGPQVSEHRRQTFVSPKFNMPRRTGGG